MEKPVFNYKGFCEKMQTDLTAIQDLYLAGYALYRFHGLPDEDRARTAFRDLFNFEGMDVIGPDQDALAAVDYYIKYGEEDLRAGFSNYYKNK